MHESAGPTPEQASRLNSIVRRLRPAKIRSAIRRRWFEATMERTARRLGPSIVELGSAYGGWAIPEAVVRPGWLCYSVGVGGDVTFDAELIRRYGARVRAFDPVPKYVDWARDELGGVEGFSVHQAALALEDGPIRMGVTHDPQSESVSSAGLYEAREFVELPGRTLDSLMRERGDERVDLLKIDIEGAEYDVVPSLDLQAAGVALFAVQLHHTGSVRDARRLVETLRDQGYELVARRPAVKFAFLRSDLIHMAARKS